MKPTIPGQWTGGRPPTKYTFDSFTIARATGLCVERVRERIRRGDFDPRDLVSLSNFIVAQRGEAAALAARAVIAAGRDGAPAGAPTPLLGVTLPSTSTVPPSARMLSARWSASPKSATYTSPNRSWSGPAEGPVTLRFACHAAR